MRKLSTIKYCSLTFYILLLLAEITSSSPCYSNYESSEEVESSKGPEYQIKNRSIDVRDLYELLLKKQALDDPLGQSHQIVRKSNRSPSLRLRFGKRRDLTATNPKLMGRPYQYFEDVDN